MCFIGVPDTNYIQMFSQISNKIYFQKHHYDSVILQYIRLGLVKTINHPQKKSKYYLL